MQSVKKAYDLIGADWDNVRSRQRSWLSLFEGYFKENDVVLDAGCGNAINACAIAGKVKELCAVDFSATQVAFAKQNLSNSANARVLQASIASLPFTNGFFDVVCCFAVLHHLNEMEQRKAFSELRRVIAKNGLLLISVWNKNQPRFAQVKRKWTLVKWGKKAKRYYYFFSLGELVGKAKGFSLVDGFFEKHGKRFSGKGAENLCLVLRKK